MRKTDKITKHSGAISNVELQAIKERECKALVEIRSIEKKVKKKLHRIAVPKGYVLTTNPDKWIDYNKT